MHDLAWMLAPVTACLVVVAALGWFGLHVLQRGVIFVDLALAQIAALGATFAVYLGHDPDEPIALGLSIVFTGLGAFAFAAIRDFEDRVSGEALIGIGYAVSAALGILLVELAADPHGAEKIQHLLVGNIVWVRWSEIGIAAAAIAGMGVLHAIFGKTLLAVSFDPAGARRRGVRIALWDLFFYLTFGIVLTAIVSIVGVLLVFSFLVIPAVVARLFVDSIPARLGLAWLIGTVASVVGVSVSYEHSTGPIVVAILGAVLVTALSVVDVLRSPRPARRAALVVGVGATFLVALVGVSRLLASGHSHHHDGEAVDSHLDEHQGEEHQGHEHDTADPLTLLGEGVRLARAGDPRGLVLLADLTRTAPPFVRMEAHDRLAVVAGATAPPYDPLATADEAGLWAAWAAKPPEGWQALAAQMEEP